MMRWAIFPTSVVEEDANTAVKTIMADQDADGDVFTITGINLGKVDINTLPAGFYIKNGKKFMTR